ncbi:LAFA_0E03466g1_1 [Lachancea sp. 'fantastica']|nr:LAFA_0E03466g1_1 [Lachancea sp. 'fantastica']
MTQDAELSFQSLRIVFSDRIRGNFVRLPVSIVHVLENTSIPVQEFGITINTDGNKVHVGWDGFEALQSLNGQSCVEINPILASAHKIREGSVVDLSIRQFDQGLVASEVYVEPQSSDDWEVIDGNARFIQDNMLSQTRIVVQDELLICYVEQTVAKFTIQKIVPHFSGAARITTDTLVMVAPKVNRSRLVNGKSERHDDTRSVHKPSVLRTVQQTENLRGYSMRVAPQIAKSSLALVSIIKNPLEPSSEESSEEETKLERAQSIAVSVTADPQTDAKHVALSRFTWDSLGIDARNGYKLKVAFVSLRPEQAPPSVLVYPIDQSESGKKTLFGGKLSNSQQHVVQSIKAEMIGSVLTNRLVLPLDQVYIELVSETGEHVPFYEWKDAEVDFRYMDKPVKVLKNHFFETKTQLPRCIGMGTLLDQMQNHLTLPIMSSGCSLVTGSSGMGKTLLIKQLKTQLEATSTLYVEYVDCEDFMDNTNFVKMKQTLQRLMASCYWYAPSLLILDNAEILFPHNKSEEETQPQSNATEVSTRLSRVFIQELEQLSKKVYGSVRVLLTAERRENLNQALFSRHAIGKTWHLEAPGREFRGSLMGQFLSDKSLSLSDGLDLSTLASESEGYSPRDLLLFSETLLCEHLCDQLSTSIPVTKNTFERTIATFTPSSLRGIKLQKDTGVKWSSVGAMHRAKELLLETLEWPTKYAPIFSKCPLRLRSGILLYGYPGCGKTMLASAVAQQCGVNFISIKGPEILNKYIGASEQSVRECFERAQAARPCVLFFDEFDSIAPKRGHDSIGVTDRVVNQMLTQMDGAEGLEGVYVLAATSRPDLIDSALLRPGRLDKSVLCGLPSASERLEILETIIEAGGMSLEEDCDLQEVANATEGMSGADLQGLCYTAHLKSVHRKMELVSEQTQPHSRTDGGKKDSDGGVSFEYFLTNGESSDSESLVRAEKILSASLASPEISSSPTLADGVTVSEKTSPRISRSDLQSACRETKPSISSAELQKLTKIYGLFSSNRDAKMPSGEASNEIGGRMTLM